MTAAARAGRLSDTDDRTSQAVGESVEFTEEVARIARAQFAAVLGNLIFVIPTVVLINLLWRGLHGQAFYSVEKATAAIGSISLFHSGVIVFAALTGVILWISSVGAGFAENFVVVIRAKEIIGGHRVLKRIFGTVRAHQIGEAVVRNTTGVASSVFLGFLLAGTPILADFFGLPLGVMHVTLTTGTLAFSYLALGSSKGLLLSILTVLIIGGLNFGVSFFLAIMTALRARNANLKRAAVLFRTSRKAFFSRPWLFFFPPKDPI
jgi:site-specific recombinase